MKKIGMLMILCLIAAGLLAGCSGTTGTSNEDQSKTVQLDRPDPPAEFASLKSPKMSAQDIEVGKKKYEINCISCHGEKGMGDGPAASSLDPKPQPLALNESKLTDAYLFWRISEGGLQDPFNSAMPSWKAVLSEKEIWQMIAYLHQLGKQG